MCYLYDNAVSSSVRIHVAVLSFDCLVLDERWSIHQRHEVVVLRAFVDCRCRRWPASVLAAHPWTLSSC